jgi:two-component sensor histidine kinase
VEALVRAQLAHFKDLIGTRVRIQGPPIKITAPAAQGIGMALHELATNAGKYGALSSDDGTLEVSWVMDENQAPPLFRITWRESGGPPVIQPEKMGFGHTVIVDLAQAAVRGEARLDFAKTGIVWELKGPVDEICERLPAAAYEPRGTAP